MAGAIVVPIFRGDTVVGAIGIANRQERLFGGMTELADSDLTEEQEMSLSGHSTPDAKRRYVKPASDCCTQAQSMGIRTKSAQESEWRCVAESEWNICSRLTH